MDLLGATHLLFNINSVSVLINHAPISNSQAGAGSPIALFVIVHGLHKGFIGNRVGSNTIVYPFCFLLFT